MIIINNYFFKHNSISIDFDVLFIKSIWMDNFTRITLFSNSTPRRLSSYLLLALLPYFFFIFYLPRCSLPNFPSVSSLVSLPLLSCCPRTTSVIFPLSTYHRAVKRKHVLWRWFFFPVFFPLKWQSIRFFFLF